MASPQSTESRFWRAHLRNTEFVDFDLGRAALDQELMRIGIST